MHLKGVTVKHQFKPPAERFARHGGNNRDRRLTNRHEKLLPTPNIAINGTLLSCHGDKFLKVSTRSKNATGTVQHQPFISGNGLGQSCFDLIQQHAAESIHLMAKLKTPDILVQLPQHTALERMNGWAGHNALPVNDPCISGDRTVLTLP